MYIIVDDLVTPVVQIIAQELRELLPYFAETFMLGIQAKTNASVN